MNSGLENETILEFGEEFDENSVEYKAFQDIKKILNYIPQKGNEINYMRSLNEIYEHYLIMMAQYDNMEDSTYEAEYISGIVHEFFFENTTEV